MVETFGNGKMGDQVRHEGELDAQKQQQQQSTVSTLDRPAKPHV